MLGFGSQREDASFPGYNLGLLPDGRSRVGRWGGLWEVGECTHAGQEHARCFYFINAVVPLMLTHMGFSGPVIF